VRGSDEGDLAGLDVVDGRDNLAYSVLPLRKPRSDFGRWVIGTIWATGLPRFVTMMGSPVDATSSMASRHFALNSPAGMIRDIDHLLHDRQTADGEAKTACAASPKRRDLGARRS